MLGLTLPEFVFTAAAWTLGVTDDEVDVMLSGKMERPRLEWIVAATHHAAAALRAAEPDGRC